VRSSIVRSYRSRSASEPGWDGIGMPSNAAIGRASVQYASRSSADMRPATHS
jgi:hypothetical protein